MEATLITQLLSSGGWGIAVGVLLYFVRRLYIAKETAHADRLAADAAKEKAHRDDLAALHAARAVDQDRYRDELVEITRGVMGSLTAATKVLDDTSRALLASDSEDREDAEPKPKPKPRPR